MALAKELRKLEQQPPDGIKVALNEAEITDVVAEISGPGTQTEHISTHILTHIRYTANPLTHHIFPRRGNAV